MKAVDRRTDFVLTDALPKEVLALFGFGVSQLWDDPGKNSCPAAYDLFSEVPRHPLYLKAESI